MTSATADLLLEIPERLGTPVTQLLAIVLVGPLPTFGMIHAFVPRPHGKMDKSYGGPSGHRKGIFCGYLNQTWCNFDWAVAQEMVEGGH